MNFTKLKLLGYYRTERQTMRPEEFRIDEANELAEKFKVSFADVKDTDLADILNSNAVMIFRDSQHKLYAYFSSEKIARVTEVVYNPKAINKPQRKFAGWFTPGEPFVIGDIDAAHDNSLKQQRIILLKDIKKNLQEYKNSDFRISTYRDDFLIHLGKNTYALDWDDDVRIKVSDLYRLIAHKWTYLLEFDTSDYCGDCDGYNYDNCDLDRCKHNCEKCGGRRYVCNNSCFNYRNDTALRIEFTERLHEDIKQAIGVMDCISRPFYTDSEILEQQYHSMLESIYKDCGFITDYIRYDDLIDYMRRYNQMNRLLECRGSDSAEVQKTKLTIGATEYLLKSSDLKVEVEGWIWKEYYIVIESAYDYISDSLVSIKREWKSKDKTYRKDFIASIESCNVSEISISNNSLYFEK